MANSHVHYDATDNDHDPRCAQDEPTVNTIKALDAADEDIADDADDPIFQEEQAHLSTTYTKLEQLAQDAMEQLEKIASQASTDKRSMGEELTVNFDSADDVIETYAAFASMNRIIEAYNLSHDINARRLSDIRMLLRQPYFAKVTLQFDRNKQPRDIYIGDAGVHDEDHRYLVVDWRSPIAETYYNQEMGPTSYKANGRTINVDLLVRRQFDIRENKLLSYFDTTVAIQDALLLASLKQHRSAQMQAITATIQKEQNRVIRHDDAAVLLVNGVAGSGKTSVMLQRIAYLLYRDRDTLDANDITIITPNPVFRRYIDQVLPSMGESNPRMCTFDELMQQLLPASLAKTTDRTEVDTLTQIDSASSSFALEADDLRDVECDGVVLLRAGSIRKVAEQFRNAREGSHRITLIREELIGRLQARLGQMSAQESVWDEVAELPLDEQLRLFQCQFDPQDEQEAKRLARIYLEERFADAMANVENDRWLRIDRIARRMLGRDDIRPLEWLYVKMLITGAKDTKTKHVMIDEVQDYSQAQLMVLARYYPYASFMLLGDPNQAITSHSASFADVRDIFVRSHEAVDECFLSISYRSTPAIAELFGRLARQDGNKAKLESVQRDDEPPTIIECSDRECLMNELGSAISQARLHAETEGGLCAVIAPDEAAARTLVRELEEAGCDTPELIDDDGKLPEEGVIVTSLGLAKGLEFDAVIVPDASEEAFGSSDLDRRRLYTTLSRATRRLTILSCGTLTSWLKQ